MAVSLDERRAGRLTYGRVLVAMADSPTLGRIRAATWGWEANDGRSAASMCSPSLLSDAALRLAGSSLLLDVGCGVGGLTGLLAADLGCRAMGIDSAAAAVRSAHGRHTRPGLDFAVADMNALPFPDRTFDAVTAFDSLQLGGPSGPSLAEFRRVLRPEGMLVATVSFGVGDVEKWPGRLTSAGFAVIDQVDATAAYRQWSEFYRQVVEDSDQLRVELGPAVTRLLLSEAHRYGPLVALRDAALLFAERS